MAGVLGVVGPLVGIGSSLGGLFGGGGAQSVQLPQGYEFQNTGAADNAAFSGAQGLSQYNIPPQILQLYQQLAQGGANNPYAQSYQQGANQIGAAGMNAGQQTLGTSQGLLPDVSALVNMGFDPQGALYQRTLQQVQDASRANSSAAGVGSTPYGAGVNNMATNNFNIDWQNQQLGRALQGAQGGANLLGASIGGINAGLGQMQGGAALPYNTAQGINTNSLQALSGVPGFNQGAAGIPQQQVQDFLSYLAASTGQQGANNQTARLGLDQNAMQFGQSQILGGNLGSGLAGLSRGFSNNNNPFGQFFSGNFNPIGV